VYSMLVDVTFDVVVTLSDEAYKMYSSENLEHFLLAMVIV
jgi:hypothetical protein